MVELDQLKSNLNAYEEPLGRNEGFTLTWLEKSAGTENWKRKVDEPGFWDHPEESQRLMKELKYLQEMVKKIKSLITPTRTSRL